MNIKSNIRRVECPVCSNRLLDKVEGAKGQVQSKCQRCKRVWEVDLDKNEFKLLSGKAIPRRYGAGE